MKDTNEVTLTITRNQVVHIQFEDVRGLIEIDTRKDATVQVLDFDQAELDEVMLFTFTGDKIDA